MTTPITAEAIGAMVVEAVKAQSMNSARTAQQADNRIGASEVGLCRSYLQRMIRQEEKREDERVPWQAFIGTALGDALERALAAVVQGVWVQDDVLATLPSGLTIPGHIDAYGEADEEQPGWVLDFKAKDGVIVVSRQGDIDRSHKYQVALYWLALVQAGKIRPDAPAFVVYVDRSGKTWEPFVKEVTVDQALIAEIDEWLGDVIYAVRNGEEASRDRPYEFCEVACPFFFNCRGSDEFHAQGLITDEEALTAIKVYQEAAAAEKAAKKAKDEAKAALAGISGSNGEVVLSWTQVNESQIESYTRAGYTRLNMRRVPK